MFRASLAMAKLIRVMVVDDSAVVRGMWARVLDAEEDIRVVAAAWNGRSAIDVLRRREVDVILLDVEMPEMDGLEALPFLLADCPGVSVIMVSSMTSKGAEVTLRALSLGASDYVSKPSATDGTTMASVGAELVGKVRALGRSRAAPAPPISTAAGSPRLRTGSARREIRAVVVASSTGGPNALTCFLSGLPPTFPLPILIVQHMPPPFTPLLAERLGRAGKRPCVEATDETVVRSGVTYIAPGDYHMAVERFSTGERLRLTQDAQENFCRPAADVLFRTAAPVYDGALAAVVLTGMGQDGLAGSRVVHEHGGLILAQDEASSVVWGMPGAVVKAELADHILPLANMASFVDDLVGLRR